LAFYQARNLSPRPTRRKTPKPGDGGKMHAPFPPRRLPRADTSARPSRNRFFRAGHKAKAQLEKDDSMQWLVWGGALVSLIGLCGLVLSIVKVAKARNAGLSDEELRVAVQKVMPLNLGSLFLSVIGLMLVILGLFLA
jgi:hypothetical protein